MVLHAKVGWFSNIEYLRVNESLSPSYDSKRLATHVYSSLWNILSKNILTFAEKG